MAENMVCLFFFTVKEKILTMVEDSIDFSLLQYALWNNSKHSCYIINIRHILYLKVYILTLFYIVYILLLYFTIIELLTLGVGDTANFGIDPIPTKYRASIADTDTDTFT